MRRNQAQLVDKSGSCALVCLVTESHLYIANVGDSRAILSRNSSIEQVTTDQKPSNPSE